MCGLMVPRSVGLRSSRPRGRTRAAVVADASSQDGYSCRPACPVREALNPSFGQVATTTSRATVLGYPQGKALGGGGSEATCSCDDIASVSIGDSIRSWGCQGGGIATAVSPSRSQRIEPNCRGRSGRGAVRGLSRGVRSVGIRFGAGRSAFTLERDTAVDDDVEAGTEDPGAIPTDRHRSAISWIARNYIDFDSGSDADVDLPRAAAQLAIWALWASDELPDDDSSVVKRASDLYDAALKHDDDPLSDTFQRVELGELTVDRTASYFDGEKVDVRTGLAGSPRPIANQIVSIYRASDGVPYRWGTTNSSGILSADIPWELRGSLTFRWRTVVPIGTYLIADDTFLITSQGIPLYQEYQYRHEEGSILAKGYAAGSVALSQLSGPIGIGVGLIVVVGALAGAWLVRNFSSAAVKRSTPLAVGGLVLFLITWYLAVQGQEDEYRPVSLTRVVVPRESVTALSPSSWTASSSFGSDYTAGCLVDTDADTSWISGRGYGIGEWAGVRFDSGITLTQLAIVPGLVTSLNAYGDNGFPAEIEIMSNSGQLASITLRRRGDLDSARAPVMQELDRPLTGHTFYLRVLKTDVDSFSYAIAESTFRGLEGELLDSGQVPLSTDEC